MGEIVVKVPGEVDPKFMSELEKDIRAVVRLKMARKVLLKEWDRRFADSELTDEECLKMGRKVNRKAATTWK